MTPAPSDVPVPEIDAEPGASNEAGGVDAVEAEATFPPVTPDVPLSAQVTDDEVPVEIQQPEEPDTEANLENPAAEPSA